MTFSNLSFKQHVLLLVLVTIVLRLLLLWPIELNDDEAYYWMWTHMPSLSYFDNTPGAGWFLMPFVQLFGDHAMVLRLVTALTGAFTSVAIALAASSFDPSLNEQQRIRVLWLSSLSIVVFTLTVVWTPDAPLLLFSALAFWQLFIAVNQGSQQAWILSGVFLALALLAKANTGLYIAFIGIWMLLYPPVRAQLKTPAPWIALLLIVLALLPVIIWNMQNDWAFLKFQGIHIFAPEAVNSHEEKALKIHYDQVLTLLVAYLLLAGPAMIQALKKYRQIYRSNSFNPAQHLAFSLAFSTTLLFLLVSLYKSFAANWAVVSVLLLFIVGISQLVKASSKWQWWQAAMVIPVILLLLALNYIPATVNKALNWRSGLVWEHIYHTMRKEQDKLAAPSLLAANKYQDASQLAYYERSRWSQLPGQHAVPAINIDGRSNHYAHVWLDQSYRGHNLLFIMDHAVTSKIEPYFCSAQLLGKFKTVYLGQTITEYYLFYGEKFLGRPDVARKQGEVFDRAICALQNAQTSDSTTAMPPQ